MHSNQYAGPGYHVTVGMTDCPLALARTNSMYTMNIEGQDYSLFRDYDQGKFHFLSDAGRVTYLEERVRLILIEPCRISMKDAETNYMGLIPILFT
jgi:hypothetical protein